MVEPPAFETPSEPASTRQRFSVTRLTILVAAVLMAAALGAGLLHYRPFGVEKTVPVRNKSLIVLPLENLSGDKDQNTSPTA